MPKLCVNVDHVATLRQARLAKEPDPVTAAHLCELAGAQGIIVHLREDRRHIQDRDVALIQATVKTNLHLEMAATGEMQRIALETRPHMVCLVPEKRQELTTEGGLDVIAHFRSVSKACARLRDADIRVSLFVDPDPAQLQAAADCGAPVIELHTGTYAEETGSARQRELERLQRASEIGQDLGLQVNAGHGLHYENVHPIVDIPQIVELNIGHAIVARALFVGLGQAVREMRTLMTR